MALLSVAWDPNGVSLPMRWIDFGLTERFFAIVERVVPQVLRVPFRLRGRLWLA